MSRSSIVLFFLGIIASSASATPGPKSSNGSFNTASTVDAAAAFDAACAANATCALASGHDRTRLRYSIPRDFRVPLVARPGTAHVPSGVLAAADVSLEWEGKRQHLVVDVPAIRESVFTKKHLSIRCDTFTKPPRHIKPGRFNFNRYCHRTHGNLMFSCKVPLDHISRNKHAHCPGGRVFLGCGQRSQEDVSHSLKVALHFEAEKSLPGRKRKQWFEGWALGKCPDSGRDTSAFDPLCDASGRMVQQFDVPINCTVIG